MGKINKNNGFKPLFIFKKIALYSVFITSFSSFAEVSIDGQNVDSAQEGYAPISLEEELSKKPVITPVEKDLNESVELDEEVASAPLVEEDLSKIMTAGDDNMLELARMKMLESRMVEIVPVIQTQMPTKQARAENVNLTTQFNYDLAKKTGYFLVCIFLALWMFNQGLNFIFIKYYKIKLQKVKSKMS